MKKIIYLFIFLPVILQAQELLFELQPEAFPVELNGWQMYSPWAGGINYSTPKLCDLDNDIDLDLVKNVTCKYTIPVSERNKVLKKLQTENINRCSLFERTEDNRLFDCWTEILIDGEI